MKKLLPLFVAMACLGVAASGCEASPTLTPTATPCRQRPSSFKPVRWLSRRSLGESGRRCIGFANVDACARQGADSRSE